MSAKWDLRHLNEARIQSTYSKDPNKKVGAIVTLNNRITGVGYNGFPPGVEDSPYRLSQKDLKNMLMIHAEVNAVYSARGAGDTIYVYPCLPCTQCLGFIKLAGIKRIVTHPPNYESAWRPDLVEQLAQEMEISINYYDIVSNQLKHV